MDEGNRNLPSRRRSAGTIAFPARLVTIGGGLLLLAGIALLYSALERSRAASPDAAELVGDGDLRPGMAQLPPNPEGVVIVVADREVSQGQFFRTTGTLLAAVAAGAGKATSCPARLDRNMPVTCVLPHEAARYAEELTRLTNLRRPQGVPELTPCYSIDGEDVRWIDPDCTGFRLPTQAEFAHAATAGDSFYGSRPGDRQGGLTLPARSEPNPWYLYDMLGNVAEIVLVEEGGRPVWTAIGPGWNEGALSASPSQPLKGRAARVGFRIVRTIAGPGTVEIDNSSLSDVNSAVYNRTD